jgi:nicotinate-nucleotide adenylyltransferase
MKIGLFFGSFNPIHIGHLIIANIMAENTDLDKVWFVVSPHNPFKNKSSLAHEFDRLKMVELAIFDNYKLEATDIEFHLPKPSYTIDTLTHIAVKYPNHQFVLIMGEDNMVSFHKWKNFEQILKNYTIYLYRRPILDKSPQNSINHENVKIIEAPLMDISATYIRDCVSKKKSINYLVHPDVISYINSHALYV